MTDSVNLADLSRDAVVGHYMAADDEGFLWCDTLRWLSGLF